VRLVDDIRIDRLALKLSGLTEAQGRRLAMLITAGLAAAREPDAPAEQPAERDDPIHASNDHLSQLSVRVVSEVLRQLERSL
jgi:hypothetical protein